MARRDIRDVTPLGIKAINDNFIDLSYEVFGTASFTKKVEKQVAKNTEDIETFTRTVSDLEGNVSEFTQTAESIVLDFNNLKLGASNLIKNGRGNFETSSWISGYSGTTLDASTDAEARRDCGEGNILRLGNSNTEEKFAFQYDIPLKPNTTYTLNGNYYVGADSKGIGFYIIGHKSTAPLNTSPYDYVREAHTDITYSSGTYKNFSYTFTTNADEDRCFIRVDNDGSPDGAMKYIYYMVWMQEGSKASLWNPHHNEIKSLTHYFSGTGYSIYDSNGAELLSISKGMANEQNIGRVDNVAENYPLRLPFNIGAEVSIINQAVLKWDIASFRTYSKGAASGGGATSGDGGSWSSTVGVFDWTQGLAADTSGVTIDSNNLGIVHAHTVSTSKLGHRHSVVVPNHQHSTPNHAHLPDFGILITAVISNAFDIYIDGIFRTSVNAERGEVDLSSWITTNGNHTIELRSTTLKRIDANLFLKTYIRR